MNYKILHLDNDLDKDQKSFLAEMEAGLLSSEDFDEAEDSVNDVIEFYNSMNTSHNYVLSSFKNDTQIRIAKNLTDDDFIVLTCYN